MQGKRLQDMQVGDTASFTKTISESDVYGFAGITGDFNPVHIDAVYAEQSMFKHRIAHGMLYAGFISTVLGTQLPGPGTIYLSQSLRFLKPVYIGDTITAEVEVTELLEEKNRVRLSTRCRNQDAVIVAEGESVLIPRTD
ncbi:MAG: MaoC family dehydratase [Bacteroidetes bacterium]|nr:MaoC family dehydratase [Bacteroidota bacterium]